MSDGWLDKAKQAAMGAAEEAKKLAESAKNANYGEMLDKTKAMAQQAAGEAKKAASTVSSAMSKPKTESETAIVSPTVAASVEAPTTNTKNLESCLAQLKQVEVLLQEIKSLLK